MVMWFEIFMLKKIFLLFIYVYWEKKLFALVELISCIFLLVILVKLKTLKYLE